MGINKNFFVPRKKITWQENEVCTVRGLTPNDIARVTAENAADLETLIQAWQKDQVLAGLDPTNDADVSSAMEQNASKIFSSIITMVPNLAAKLIAIASDDPAEWEHVRNEFVIPLQFEILTKVAELTFVDNNGFKNFLGNVMALVQNVSGKSQSRIAPPQEEMELTPG